MQVSATFASFVPSQTCAISCVSWATNLPRVSWCCTTRQALCTGVVESVFLNAKFFYHRHEKKLWCARSTEITVLSHWWIRKCCFGFFFICNNTVYPTIRGGLGTLRDVGQRKSKMGEKHMRKQRKGKKRGNNSHIQSSHTAEFRWRSRKVQYTVP